MSLLAALAHAWSAELVPSLLLDHLDKICKGVSCSAIPWTEHCRNAAELCSNMECSWRRMPCLMSCSKGQQLITQLTSYERLLRCVYSSEREGDVLSDPQKLGVTSVSSQHFVLWR